MAKSKSLRMVFLGCAFIIALCIIYLIIKKPNTPGVQMPLVVVSAMKVEAESWQSKLMAVATLRAINGVDVTTEIPGLVQEIPFTPGSRVKKGDILVKLNADTEIAQHQSLSALADLAEITYDRDQKQFAVRAVSKAQVDIDEADLKSKRALAQQQAEIVKKKIIVAPFAGRLGISQINLGQFLNPGDKIVTLQSLDPIYVDFYLPQQNLPKLSVGQEIILKTDPYPGKIFRGKITTINPKVDPATRNVQVQATLANLQGYLLPGMFGQIEIVIGKPKEFLTLPQAAITYNTYGDLVYVLKVKEKDKQGNMVYKAHQRFVNAGEKRGDQVQILKGLEAGNLIVTSGQMKLKNGSLVTINNSVVPKNNPSPQVPNESQ